MLTQIIFGSILSTVMLSENSSYDLSGHGLVFRYSCSAEYIMIAETPRFMQCLRILSELSIGVKKLFGTAYPKKQS